MQFTAVKTNVYRFGLYEADVANSSLTRKGARVKIQDQPFRVLVSLLERPGEVVKRQELCQRLWPEGTYVDFDGSLNVILKKLRAAIDDDPDNPRFIETVPRQGYRFIAPVTIVDNEVSTSPVSPANGNHGTRVQIPEIDQHSSDGVALKVSPARLRKFVMPIGFATAILLIILVAIRIQENGRKIAATEAAPQSSVAVMPFANLHAGQGLDYLRFAIASDIVTDLTYVRSISVRPFESTTKYATDPKDPASVGRELRVSHIISGGFVNEGGNLKVTTELTRVADNHVVWTDSFSAAPNQLVRLHEELAERLQNGVITAIGGRQTAGEIPVPHSQQAYELYLRSVAMPRDPEPNKIAIAAVNKSVSSDPDYAPAWGELAWRYYLDAAYSDGGEKAYQKSIEASARAASLDPNGTYNWNTVRVEHGQLEEGYDEAQRLLSRRPDAAPAHFEMAYVYRYAGLLDQSAHECDAALAIDPGDFEFRSCAKVFMYKGDYARAQTFVDLDGSSGWSVRQRMHFALRQRDYPLALTLGTIAVASGYKDAEIVVAKLQGKSPEILGSLAARAEKYSMTESDPEEKYEIAAMLSFAGQTGRALRVLRAAINENYCATPMLETDPLLAELRGKPEFQDFRHRAAACQQTFLSHSKLQASSN